MALQVLRHDLRVVYMMIHAHPQRFHALQEQERIERAQRRTQVAQPSTRTFRM